MNQNTTFNITIDIWYSGQQKRKSFILLPGVDFKTSKRKLICINNIFIVCILKCNMKRAKWPYERDFYPTYMSMELYIECPTCKAIYVSEIDMLKLPSTAIQTCKENLCKIHKFNNVIYSLMKEGDRLYGLSKKCGLAHLNSINIKPKVPIYVPGALFRYTIFTKNADLPIAYKYFTPISICNALPSIIPYELHHKNIREKAKLDKSLSEF